MASQVLTTTFQEQEFKTLLTECITQTVKQEITKLIQPAEPQKQILTRKETAQLLSISLPTLHTYTQEGIIKAHRLGYKVRYLMSDIQDALTAINYGKGS